VLPPEPKSSPLVQTLKWSFRPLPFMQECREKYGDSFSVKFASFERPMVMISDPAAIKALYLDEKAASSIEVTLFEDLSKGELDAKQREALMRLVLRIDDISQNTKQAGLNLELIAQSKKRVPKEFWSMYKDLSKRFVAQTGALRSAIEAFGHSDDDVLKRREEVKNIEQQIDDAYFNLRKKLILSSSGPLALLVLMDVLTWVESASDRAKDAADMLYILVMAIR